MLLYQSETYNPYFNIAAEEYFLKNFDTSFFCLYINEPSIIVGKHQNTTAEINTPWVFKNNIKVVRRLSGGGAVYHDKGNLNYCFIKKGEKGNLVDFKKYTLPIINALKSLGIIANLRGKSDLVIDNMKFSGNAEHLFHNKILHHGTLLFSTELSKLNNAIKADWSKFADRAVRSNRSTVTNILPHLQKQLTINEFADIIIKTALSEIDSVKKYELTTTDKKAINKLVAEKYSNREWNFGYSPEYKFYKTINTNNGLLNISMEIKKGKIESVKLILNNKTFDNASLIEQSLINTPHYYPIVKQKLELLFQNNINLPFTFPEVLEIAF